MNFKDEMQNMQAEQAAENQRAIEAAKAPIPQDKVDEMAAYLAAILKKELKEHVSGKVISYDSKPRLFNKKKYKCFNYRYGVRRDWVLSKNDRLLRVGGGRHFPPGTVYFSEHEHDYAPTNLAYANEAHLDQLFNATTKLLEADGISARYEKYQNHEGRRALTYEAYIPCDDKGTIL